MLPFLTSILSTMDWSKGCMTILGASAISLPLAETILSTGTADEHRDDQEEDEEIDRARQRRHRTGDDRGRRAFEFQHRKRQRAPVRRFAVSCPA